MSQLAGMLFRALLAFSPLAAAEDLAELKLRYLRVLRDVQVSPNGKDEHLQESTDKAEILHEALKKLWPQVKASKPDSRLWQKYEDLQEEAQAADELVEKHFMINSIAQSQLDTLRAEIEAKAPGTMAVIDAQGAKLGLTSPVELPEVSDEHKELRAKAKNYIEALGRRAEDDDEEAPDVTDGELDTARTDYMKAANSKYGLQEDELVAKLTDEQARTQLQALAATYKRVKAMANKDPENTAKKMLVEVVMQRYKEKEQMLSAFQKDQLYRPKEKGNYAGLSPKFDDNDVPHRLRTKKPSDTDRFKLRQEAMEEMGKVLKTYRNAVMMHTEEPGNKAKSMFLQAATERINDKIHSMRPELQEPAREIIERVMDKVMSAFGPAKPAAKAPVERTES